MRVLITTLPGTGSLRPLLPIADGLSASGHDIAFCAAASFREPVESAGFRHFSAGLDFRLCDPGYLEVLADAVGGVQMPPPPGAQRMAWVTDTLFIRGAARAMLPDVCETARRWQADLILRESLEFAGCVAAEKLGLPHASVAAPADGALDQRARLAGPLAVLRRDVGLPPDPAGVMAYRYLHLCCAPPTFDGRAARFPETARFVRHVDGGDVAHLPRWTETGQSPLVLVSLGTVFHRTPGAYEAAVAGLTTEPVVAAVALGPGSDPTGFGPVPPHVHLDSLLPMRALLDRAAVLVTHGGFNSVKEAMSRGVPMIVAPIASDQHYSAARLSELGLAEVVPPDDRTGHRFQEALHAVLTDPTYRSRASEMASEMAALPPVAEAVTWLEALTRPDRAPGDVATSSATSMAL